LAIRKRMADSRIAGYPFGEGDGVHETFPWRASERRLSDPDRHS
jgi:hypothetical protein